MDKLVNIHNHSHICFEHKLIFTHIKYTPKFFCKTSTFDRICLCTKEKYDHLWRKHNLSIFVLSFILRERERERERETISIMRCKTSIYFIIRNVQTIILREKVSKEVVELQNEEIAPLKIGNSFRDERMNINFNIMIQTISKWRWYRIVQSLIIKNE